jgi:hypothetical protein
VFGNALSLFLSTRGVVKKTTLACVKGSVKKLDSVRKRNEIETVLGCEMSERCL